MTLDIHMPEFYYVLAFDDGRIRLLDHSNDIDAQISCSSSNLVQLLTSDNPGALLYSGEIELSGNSHLIDTMQQTLADLELDWEALLANLIGDTQAHSLGILSRTGRRWQQQRSASLMLDIEEYLKEEAKLLPPKPATDRFFTEVDQLRLDSDRLTARVQQLSIKMPASEHNSVHPNRKDR